MKLLSLLICGCLCSQTLMADNWKVYVAKYKQDKACAISYTFDDELSEQYSMAAPQLDKRGFKGTFAICGGYIDGENGRRDSTRMTWSEVKDLSDRGHEISNHGYRHRNFGRFPLDTIRQDIHLNDSAILVHTGKPAVTFVYPNNNKKKEPRMIAEQNRVGTRTVQRAIGGRSKADELSQWVTRLIETRDWGVGMTHGITYGYDHFKQPQILWDHLDDVKSRESMIWVGTLAEVAAYTRERDEVKLDVVQKQGKITVTPSLLLDPNLFHEPLTLVIEGQGIKKVTAKQNGKRLAVRLTDKGAVCDFNPYGGIITLKIKD